MTAGKKAVEVQMRCENNDEEDETDEDDDDNDGT